MVSGCRSAGRYLLIIAGTCSEGGGGIQGSEPSGDSTPPHGSTRNLPCRCCLAVLCLTPTVLPPL